MIFSLDVRRARKGDCLLLHYGKKTDPGLIMIDGGPSSVYAPHLKPRLKEIRTARGLQDDESLTVDLLMISHVDDDHIRGILDLTKEEIEALDAQEPLMLNVLDFWHNTFSEIIDHTPDELLATFTAQFGQAAVRGGAMSDEAIEAVEVESKAHPEIVQSGLAVIASIAQGFRLRQDARKLGYEPNVEFAGKLVMAKTGGDPIDFGKGLTLTVIGPMKPELIELHDDHIKWLEDLEAEGKSPPAALAAYVDESVPNLASIVVLAEVNNKRILLTGDARGDKILEGLELVGLVNAGGKLKVDVMKVPHHGSDNNLDDDFFERVTAKHYVFSGNGEHGNPERASLEMLFRARGSDPFVIHLTYPLDEMDVERKKNWEKERNKEKVKKLTKPTTKVRPVWSKKKHGLVAFFDDTPLANGQELKIVDEDAIHMIDLLDPVDA